MTVSYGNRIVVQTKNKVICAVSWYKILQLASVKCTLCEVPFLNYSTVNIDKWFVFFRQRKCMISLGLKENGEEEEK